MKHIKYSIFIIFLTIILGSCTEETNIFFGETPKKLIVNSIIGTDSLFKVQVYLNKNVTDPAPFVKPENAIVKIYENDQYIETLPYMNDGKYKSETFIPKEDNKYTVEVEVPNYPTAKAEIVIPKSVKIKSYEITTAQVGDMEGKRIELTLTDPIGSENYYYVEINRVDAFTLQHLGKVYIGLVYENNEIPLFNTPIGNIINQGLLLDDKAFNGNTVDIAFTTTDILSFSEKENVKLILSLKTVPKEYFDYFMNVVAQINEQESVFSTAPTNVYTNIQNGLGIFIGYSRDTVEIK